MTITNRGTGTLVSEFADEIIERLDKSYDLVYVSQDDQLTETQVAKLIRGDSEWIDESWEWECDAKYESVKQIIANLSTDVIREWNGQADADLDFISEAFEEDVDEWDRVRFTIEERDDGSWVEQLVNQTPNVLLRISAIDEDHGYSFEEVTPGRVLADLHIEPTEGNVEVIERTLAECSPEYSVLMGYWIVGADVSDIERLGYDQDTEVEIKNPYLYLGNPFAGSGFISEQPLEATVRVKRSELRTDEDAFGYAVDEVYGGLNASSFECKLYAVGV